MIGQTLHVQPKMIKTRIDRWIKGAQQKVGGGAFICFKKKKRKLIQVWRGMHAIGRLFEF